MNRIYFLLTLFLLTGLNAYTQVSINNDNTDPDPSAMMDIQSNDKGILIPRMTTALRNMINNPATGLLVFDTDTESFWFKTSTVWKELSDNNMKELTDADNDTKIQVEEGADEDTIRFDIAGAEYFAMAKGRIHIQNTKKSVFIGENAGEKAQIENPIYGGFNTYMGANAGRNDTMSAHNTGLGFDALVFNQASNNTALGSNTLQSNISGIFNTATGSSSLSRNITGNYNVGLGTYSGFTNKTGNDNVFVGSFAGTGITDDDYSQNTIIGHEAGYKIKGDANIFLGYQAGYNETGDDKLYIENSNSNTPLIYGDFATDQVRINGSLTLGNLNINDAYAFPVADGTSGQTLITDGSGQLSWGAPLMASDTLPIIRDNDKDTYISVDDGADDDLIRFSTGGTEHFMMNGDGELEVLNTNGNIYVGEDISVAVDIGKHNIAIGNEIFIGDLNGGGLSGYLHDGDHNIATGLQSLNKNEGGSYNIASGYKALSQNINGNNNVAIGNSALSVNVNGDNLIAIGANANVGSNNLNNATAIGANATVDQSNSLVLGNNAKVGIGTSAPDEKLHVVGSFKLEDGNQADGFILRSDSNGVATWTSIPSIIKDDTALLISDIDGDTRIQVEENPDEDKIRFDMGGIEYFEMNLGRINIKNTGKSVFLGNQAGLNDDLSNNANVFIGESAGKANVFGQDNIAIGHKAFTSNYGGGYNVAIGHASMEDNIGGYYNSSLGYQSLPNNTNGNRNVAIGSNALFENTTGSNNIGLGEEAGNRNQTGSDNIFIGYRVSASSTPRNQAKNVMLGSNAGYNNQGNQSIFLGYKAGFNETGSNKLYIENSGSSSPLIYGDFSADSLSLNGSLSIAQGNTQYFEFDTGRIQVFNTGNSIFLGGKAGENDDFSNNRNVGIGYEAAQSNIISSFNTAIGYQALKNNTEAENTAIGYQALVENTTGNQNTAIGSVALPENTTGSDNTAVGFYALENNTTGEDNVAIGSHALENNITGTKNIAIGYGADVGSSGLNNAIAIGTNATVSQSNSIVLGTNNVKVGIGISTPSEKLHVDGNAIISGTVNPGGLTINNAYSFPNTDGTNGQVLSTDGSGTLNWVDQNDNVPSGGTNGQVLSTDGSGNLSWISQAG